MHENGARGDLGGKIESIGEPLIRRLIGGYISLEQHEQIQQMMSKTVAVGR
jgi:hypothetical protein